MKIDRKTKLHELITHEKLSKVEFKCLWELVDFDKRFNGVEKCKQTNILKFNNLSAKKLQEYTVNNKEGSVRLL
ncbi:hypothetical protein, partial [Metamycoplasma equirhinis]